MSSRPPHHHRPSLARALSVAAALLFSAGSAPAIAGGNCVEPSNTPGCDNATVQACVCAFDSYCCLYAWDSICASEAVNQCDAHVGGSGPIDSDGDGLSDEYEYQLGTNPYLVDTDNDLLNDALEVSLGLDPTYYDTDGDGIPDGVEEGADGERQPTETDPANPDTDGDGIPDGEESTLLTRVIMENQQTGMVLKEVTIVVYPHTENSVNYPAPSERAPTVATVMVQRDTYEKAPYVVDAILYEAPTSHQKREIVETLTLPYLKDSDFDLLSDGLERSKHWNPLSMDTDGDGVPDGVEDFFKGRNPMPLGVIAAAGDGKIRISETDPSNPDSDGDGLSDGQESTLLEQYVGEDPLTGEILYERKLVAYPPTQFDSGFPPTYERAPQVVTVMVARDRETQVESVQTAILVTEPTQQEAYQIQNVMTYAFAADSDGDGKNDKKDPCPNSAENVCK